MFPLSSDDRSVRIRNAASLLVKGATLSSEPCSKCGGVQVRFEEKMMCVNCGDAMYTGATRSEQEITVPSEHAATSSGALSSAAIIEEKIGLLANELRTENDIAAQKQKAELLECYLRILEKMKSLLG
jgi:uncharacterized Zn finger protein (UPF0148 family)